MAQHNLTGILLLPAVTMAAAALPVYAVDYLSIDQAQQALFPGATQFIPYAVHLTDAQRKEIRKRSGVRQRSDSQQVWRIESGADHLGWFLLDDVIGKHEFITYALAISPQGSVLGVEVVSYRETHGGEVRTAEWRNEFVGKTLADPFKLGGDVANISGATLSCRNLLDGVKRLLVLHDMLLRNE